MERKVASLFLVILNIDLGRKMISGKLSENEGVKISIDNCLRGNKKTQQLSKAKIRTLEKELSRPHLVYDNIALTDNYLIAMDADGSPNGAFANIKYSDLRWVYVGETGGVSSINVARVLSLAKNGDENRAKTSVKVGFVVGALKSLTNIAMIGIPANTDQSILIAFSKDRTAIVATDSKKRIFTSGSSKNFRELISAIAERGPNDLMIGEQYEDAYCEMMGIDTYSNDAGSDARADEYDDDSF